MIRTRCCLRVAIVFAAFAGASAASPVLPGLSHSHPLDRRHAGALLLNELQCFACHQAEGPAALPFKSAPDLSEVGARVAPEYLQRFIADPALAQPGVAMPHTLGSAPPDQRNEIARAITHYLVSQSELSFQRDPVEERAAETGRDLYHRIGCVACHPPREESHKETLGDGLKSLAHVDAKYSLASLSDFLFNPLSVRPSGRMPEMNLTREEARALASYLLSAPAQNRTSASFQVNDGLAEQGREHFQTFRCGSCHA
ncbi:MAG: c-type cytochrome, partial [Planctomycetota bacterium]